MGQAKKRGSYSRRVELAKSRLEAIRPEHLTCNNCQSQIEKFTSVDARRIAGIQDCFFGVCEKCGQTTYALKGATEALKAIVDAVKLDRRELPMACAQNTKVRNE